MGFSALCVIIIILRPIIHIMLNLLTLTIKKYLLAFIIAQCYNLVKRNFP